MKHKFELFEYIVFKLINWYKEENSIRSNSDFNIENDLSLLKIIKLHYFVSAVNSNSNTELLDEGNFDNFVAMQYGHVESDIYTNIKTGGLSRFNINRYKTEINTSYIESLEDTFGDVKLKEEVNLSIDLLKNINGNDFVKRDAFDLVDISHSLISWKTMHRHSSSSSIPLTLIKMDSPHFI